MKKTLFAILIAAVFAAASLDAAPSQKDIKYSVDWIKATRSEIQNLQIIKQNALRSMPQKKLWSTMNCFVRCVRMLESGCRVQMAGLRYKTVPGGTYYASCPSRCHKMEDNRIERNRKGDPRYKPISGCTHYDKNGYWFVTFVCNTHKRHWNQKMILYYRLLDKQYPKFEAAYREYRAAIQKIKEKTEQLQKVQEKLQDQQDALDDFAPDDDPADSKVKHKTPKLSDFD